MARWQRPPELVLENATLVVVAVMESAAMTPPIVKNVVRMPIKREKQVRTRISYLNPEQLERFLKAAKEYGPREHAMFLFAIAHGARAQEICNLKLSDVNFNNEQVHIARLKGSLESTQSLMRVKGNPLLDERPSSKHGWPSANRMLATSFSTRRSPLRTKKGTA